VGKNGYGSGSGNVILLSTDLCRKIFKPVLKDMVSAFKQFDFRLSTMDVEIPWKLWMI